MTCACSFSVPGLCCKVLCARMCVRVVVRVVVRVCMTGWSAVCLCAGAEIPPERMSARKRTPALYVYPY